MGAAGGEEEKAEAGVLFRKEGKDSNSRRNYSSAIISQAQLADVASSVFFSNLRLILTHSCPLYQ